MIYNNHASPDVMEESPGGRESGGAGGTLPERVLDVTMRTGGCCARSKEPPGSDAVCEKPDIRERHRYVPFTRDSWMSG